MKWSKTPPTREGFYWYGQTDHFRSLLAEVWSSGSLLFVSIGSDIVHMDAFKDGYWKGPLPLKRPEPPREEKS